MRETYYLEFDDRSGTDRQRFATFRLHHAWAKRLRKGRVVYLCDTKTRQVYGKAKVLEVHAGKAEAILFDHAVLSHLEDEGYVSPESTFVRNVCASRRLRSMRKRYGPNRVSETSNLTAIILQRTG